MPTDTVEKEEKVETPLGELTLKLKLHEAQRKDALRKRIKDATSRPAVSPTSAQAGGQNPFQGGSGGTSANEQKSAADVGSERLGQQGIQPGGGQGAQHGKQADGLKKQGPPRLHELEKRGLVSAYKGSNKPHASAAERFQNQFNHGGIGLRSGGGGQTGTSDQQPETLTPEQQQEIAPEVRQQQFEAQQQQETQKETLKEGAQKAQEVTGKVKKVKGLVGFFKKIGILGDTLVAIGAALFNPVTGVIALVAFVVLLLPCQSILGKIALWFADLNFGQCALFGESTGGQTQNQKLGWELQTGLNDGQRQDASASLLSLLDALGANMHILVTSISDNRLFSGDCKPWNTNPGNCVHTTSPVLSAHYGGPDRTVQQGTAGRTHSTGFSCAADIWSENIPALVQLLTQLQSSRPIVNIRCEASGTSNPTNCNSGNVGHVHVAVSGCGAR